jgi:Fe-S-cluster containining protein
MPPKIITLSTLNPRDQFERTACGCKQCVACCCAMPGYLLPGDLERIAEYKRIPADRQNFWTLWMLRHFQASDGAKVGAVGPTGELRVFSIPTIVPRLLDGGCVFLRDALCTIHPVAPWGCGWFESHMLDGVADLRAKMGLRYIMDHRYPDYQTQWEVLYKNNKRALPTVERRAHLENLLDTIKETSNEPD